MVVRTQALAQEFYIRPAEAGREKLADIQKSLPEFDHRVASATTVEHW